MSNCRFIRNADGTWTCRCREYTTRVAYGRAPSRNCPHLGLGGWLAKVLKLIGLTKERYRWLRGRKRIVGGMCCWIEELPPEVPSCGCARREQQLDDLWSRLAGFLSLSKP